MLELLTSLINKVIKINDTISNIIKHNSLSTSGLTCIENRVIIKSGGYRQIGKICQVQLYLTGNATLAANDYWTLMSGFPPPVNQYATLSAVQFTGTAPINVYISGSSLGIVLGNQNITSGSVIFITGTYITL